MCLHPSFSLSNLFNKLASDGLFPELKHSELRGRKTGDDHEDAA